HHQSSCLSSIFISIEYYCSASFFCALAKCSIAIIAFFIFHENSDKLKLSKKFITACQLLKEDLNQFYFKLFNLEIQSEHTVSTENYHIRLLKFLQNLMNQHDHEYFIIQHVITHADKL